MYEAFTGKVIRRGPTDVVLEVQGIAYRFTVPLSTSRELPSTGPARLLSHLVVRDDRLELVGFATESERTLFRHLISVSGIGPAIALQVLSRAPVTQFVAAVCQEDRAYLGAIKGVGKKTVDRILVELAEPLRKSGLLDATAADETPVASPLRDEAVRALGTLGLTPSAAKRAVEKAEQRLGPEALLEELVKAALTEV